MAVTGIKISQLTDGKQMQPTDVIEIERNGGSYKVAYAALADSLNSSLGLADLANALETIIGG